MMTSRIGIRIRLADCRIPFLRFSVGGGFVMDHENADLEAPSIA